MFLQAQQCADAPRYLRPVAQWLVLAGGLLFGGAFIVGSIFCMARRPAVFTIAVEHFPATFGLPSAALMALCIVVFLESTSGDIQFKALGFEFHGASGPIVLWVLCFLAITAAIKLLWGAPERTRRSGAEQAHPSELK